MAVRGVALQLFQHRERTCDVGLFRQCRLGSLIDSSSLYRTEAVEWDKGAVLVEQQTRQIEVHKVQFPVQIQKGTEYDNDVPL